MTIETADQIIARIKRENGLPINSKRATNEGDADNAGDAGKTSASKKILVIEKGELPQVAEKLRDIIAASDEFFDRGGPVRITKKAGNKLPVASLLTSHGVVRAAHKLCRPIKDGENATLPERVAALYLDMVGEWKLPPLVVISTAPILADDGSIRSAEGYDKETGIYCCNVPELEIPERPTRAEAVASLLTLRQTFRTFPFSDAVRKHDKALSVDVVDDDAPIGHDETALLNGLLTAICRPSLWLAPGLLLNAPSISGAGTGKGLLVRSISIIAYGDRPRPFTAGNDHHEMDKRLVSEVIEGNPIVFMDNVNGVLLRFELATFFALTGNGLSISEDLARRLIYAGLDAQCEDPEQRAFGPGFLEDIEARRAELLGAALTMWRWGRQNKQKAGITLGSFEMWGKWVRDPLLALGCKDPVARLSEIKARDPERQRVIELFNAWWESHGSNPVKVSELVPEVQEIADPSKRGRQYIARAIGNLAGPSRRLPARTVRRSAEQPERRRSLANFPDCGQAQGIRVIRSIRRFTKYGFKSKAYESENSADDPADDGKASAGIRKSSASQAPQSKPRKIKDLPIADADNADDADDSDKSPAGQIIGNRGVQPLTDIEAVNEELRSRGEIVANGYAVSSPAPGQLTARIWIREIWHPAIKSGPTDNLDDFTAL